VRVCGGIEGGQKGLGRFTLSPTAPIDRNDGQSASPKKSLYIFAFTSATYTRSLTAEVKEIVSMGFVIWTQKQIVLNYQGLPRMLKVCNGISLSLGALRWKIKRFRDDEQPDNFKKQ